MYLKWFCLNFAHPLPKWVEKKYKIISTDFQVPPEILSEPEKFANYVAESVLRIANSDPKLKGAIATGKFVLNPPGLSAANAIVLAVLHGLSGHFPRIIWTYRGEEGFEVIKEPLALQPIRDMSRAGRSFGRGVEVLRSEETICEHCGNPIHKCKCNLL